MEIRTKKCKSGNIWQLVNESWSNSNGWGHKTNIIRNGYDFGEHKVKYLNRTWESYTYQTCMSGAISTIYEDELNRYIENYKYNNDIVRFKKGQKDEVIKMFEETEIAKDIQEIRKAISNRDFDNLKR